MQAAITFNELEWRSDAVGASAGRVISNVAKQSTLAARHYHLLLGLRSINDSMTDLLHTMHSPECVKVLESASPEKLLELGQRILEVQSKVRMAIVEIRASDLGYWRNLYNSRLKSLEIHNKELTAHGETFRNSADSPLLILSSKDQDFVLKSLTSPSQPNDALCRAFERK